MKTAPDNYRRWLYPVLLIVVWSTVFYLVYNYLAGNSTFADEGKVDTAAVAAEAVNGAGKYHLATCVITRWLDADTVEVIAHKHYRIDLVESDVYFAKKIKVRLEHCWAAETKRTDIPGEKEKGIAALAVAVKRFPVGTVGQVALRISKKGKLVKSFDRHVGQINDRSGLNIGKWLIDEGHAFATEAELKKWLEKSQKIEKEDN